MNLSEIEKGLGRYNRIGIQARLQYSALKRKGNVAGRRCLTSELVSAEPFTTK
jgi:hypothetical protein